MARTIFDPQHRASIEARVKRLAPSSERRFGRMTAPEMICHLKDSLEVAIGVTSAKPRTSFMSNRVARHIIIYYMPWPKGKAKTVPELLTTKPTEFEADRNRLLTVLRYSAERGPQAQLGNKRSVPQDARRLNQPA